MKTFLALMLAATAFHISARIAEPHDAPSGWSYDGACCTIADCRPADGPEEKIRHHPIQILIEGSNFRVMRPNGTSELIPTNSTKIRNSRDGDFHICTYAGSDITGVICIYVPPYGY